MLFTITLENVSGRSELVFVLSLTCSGPDHSRSEQSRDLPEKHCYRVMCTMLLLPVTHFIYECIEMQKIGQQRNFDIKVLLGRKRRDYKQHGKMNAPLFTSQVMTEFIDRRVKCSYV